MNTEEKTKQLQALFENKYEREKWLTQLQQFFSQFELFLEPERVEYQRKHFKPKHFLYLGNVSLKNSYLLPIGIYEIEVGEKNQLVGNQTPLQNMVAKQSESQGLGGALVVYHDGEKKWRFNFISIEHKLTEIGELRKEQTVNRRYADLLGESMNMRTAVSHFAQLSQTPSLEDLKKSLQLGTLLNEKRYNYFLYRFKVEVENDIRNEIFSGLEDKTFDEIFNCLVKSSRGLNNAIAFRIMDRIEYYAIVIDDITAMVPLLNEGFYNNMLYRYRVEADISDEIFSCMEDKTFDEIFNCLVESSRGLNNAIADGDMDRIDYYAMIIGDITDVIYSAPQEVTL